MGVLFIVFAMAMIFATIYEHRFGATAARVLVYYTKWFELILFLLVVNLVGQIVQFKLYKRKKLTVMLFHLAFILIIAGAGITRYFGFEGSMHIREGENQNNCTTLDNYLTLEVSDLSGKNLFTDSKKLILSPVKKIKYKKGFEIDGKKYLIKFARFIPNAIVFEQIIENEKEELYLWLIDGLANKVEFVFNTHIVKISYKPFEIELPFNIKLEDFILERYPGSNSPSSYKSNVVVIDEKNDVNTKYSIYMNHILKYKGWRFYQSSYDRDEMGTILSVNKDIVGMTLTYIGYFMLFFFIILSTINKDSVFRTVTKSYFKSSSGKVMSLLILFLSVSFSGTSQDEKLVIEKSKADDFGKILVQNQKGRTEPLYTLSHDILRKVSRRTEIGNYTPMQVFLGLYFDFQNWQNFPLIKISNAEIIKTLEISGEYAAFSDIVDLNTNSYKLKQSVQVAYSKPSGARNKYDKEIIKVDERLNICFMIYTGEFMKIFPVNDKLLKWHSPEDAYKYASGSEDSLYLRNIVNFYAQGVQAGNTANDFIEADKIIKSILDYQRNFAQYELPSEVKVKAEIFYYKSKIYDRLFPFYATIGLLLLFILLYRIISQNRKLDFTIRIFTGFLIIGFLFHTLGLGIRWYVSGHAPMSNGYESMIFISWVTILAGFIFRKNSAFVLAATSVLAGFTLMVAHLSFMDPQITNLVPVLQSYWLTLHVSIITGSYGFLGLGAIIGIIVLILYSLSTKSNNENILSTIEELTVINYKALTIGLYLLTIGTFLGAVWANESWGRYWGWDPKETWSLITIIVYSFIIHSRMISGLKGFYQFNILTLFGFSSVLMTYFGVNYYLSGLHSYAGGDSVPVPNFVYISIILLISLSVFAYWRKNKVFK